MVASANKAPPLLRIAHVLTFTTYLRKYGAPADSYLHRCREYGLFSIPRPGTKILNWGGGLAHMSVIKGSILRFCENSSLPRRSCRP